MQDANFYRKSYKFGSKVVLTGILFDKQRGIVVWRGTASGETVEYSTLGSLIPGVKGGEQKNASMRAAKELSGMMDKR